MADYEEGNAKVCKEGIVKTKAGIDKAMHYLKSAGRSHGVTDALRYPVYGQGGLAEYFFHRAAVVGGCISILDMPVVGLLVDKDVENYKGVQFVTGQEVFSHQLILSPALMIPRELNPSPSVSPQDGREKVFRGICITDSSFIPDVANCLAFCYPKSLCPDQMTSVRILQLSSNVNACPPGMFVVYLSTVFCDVVQRKRSINAAMEALFSSPTSGYTEDDVVKPTLLWSTSYIQELIMGGFGHRVSSTHMLDGNLHYNHVLDVVLKLFQKMYPDEEFFPQE